MCGVAGAGKTTFAQRLEAAGHVRLSVDTEVWATAGRCGVDYPQADYAELTRAANDRLRARLADLLDAGRDVVVDLSFWRRADRDAVKAIVEAHGGRSRLVHLKVPHAELRRRLDVRARRFDADAAFPIDDALLDRYLAGVEEPDGEGEEIIEFTSSPAPGR